MERSCDSSSSPGLGVHKDCGVDRRGIFGLIDSVAQGNINDGYNSDANLEGESDNVIDQLFELETGK